MGVLDDAIREHLELKRRHGADPVVVARLEREALGPVTAAELEIADDDEQWADEPGLGSAPYDDADPHATALMQQPPTEAYQAPPEAAAPPPAPAAPAPAPPVFHPPAAQAPPPPPPAAAPPVAAPPAAPAYDATVPPPPPPAEVRTSAARFRDEDELDEEFEFTGELDEPVTGQPPAPPAPPAAQAPPPPPPAAAPPAPAPPAAPPAPPAAATPPPPAAPPAGPPPAAGQAPPPAVAPLPRTRIDDGAPATQGDTTQGDVLSDTPDFLQETPDHDRLWFEQKPPKDFDF